MLPRLPALLFIALCLASGAAPRRDLDVGVPPGSPLEWGSAFPGITPPNAPLFPRSGDRSASDSERSTAVPASGRPDVRFSSSFGLVRILTWDLAGHLTWIGPRDPSRPVTGMEPGSGSRYGDPLYWVTLAPLLRLMLHPEVVSRDETIAHLIEIGTPSLGVADVASSEESLREVCDVLRERIQAGGAAFPMPDPRETVRETMLARFCVDELLREHPYDPRGTFGARLFLFSEDVEPILIDLAEHETPAVRRAAVAALGRYRSRSALRALLRIAATAEDPVVCVRALAGASRFRGRAEWAPVVERLRGCSDRVVRAALLGALGRAGVRDAAPVCLELAREALAEKDPDLLLAVLSALAHIPPAATDPPGSPERDAGGIPALAEEIAGLTDRRPADFAPRGPRSVYRADRSEGGGARAVLLGQLARLVALRHRGLDEADGREVAAWIGDAGHPLERVHPPARHLFLDALGRLGEPGASALERVVSDKGVEAPVRGYALSRLSWEDRTRLASALAGAEEDPETRIQALEVLLADHHPAGFEACRAIMEECALTPAGEGGPARRFLFLRALRALSEAGRIEVADLLPLVPHARSARETFGALPLELRRRTSDLVALATADARQQDLERRVAELVDLVVVNEMNAAIGADSADDARARVTGQLASVRAHRSDPGYLQLVTETILQDLLGYATPLGDPGRAEFGPDVPLEEEIVLSLGRTRDPRAAEVLIQLLGQRRNANRGVACLALAMTGAPGGAHHLAPYLLDEEGFVRLCAYEGLRRLTGKDVSIDWIHASGSERFRAAEEYWKWILDREEG